MVSSSDISRFRKKIWHFYKKHGRQMPWRHEEDPYKVLVSEIMLQQTQVPRVKVKYAEFLKTFPTAAKLANAEKREVIAAWQGLGYNRRALFLKRAAEEIVRTKHFPVTPEELLELPGIGKGTAGSFAAFAFNYPSVFIETNIRRVFLHEFFPKRKNVPDAKLFPLIEMALDKKNPREWYYALMDYGAHLAATEKENANVRSSHYKKQPPLKGSVREARGFILKALSVSGSISKQKLFGGAEKQGIEAVRMEKALAALAKEGMVKGMRTISLS